MADDEICLLVQAESTTAMANLAAICAVDGVDGVFIGPADLAASMGHRGKRRPPRGPGRNRGRHQDHHRQRQGRRHPDRRHGSGAPLPGAGLPFVAVGVDVLVYANAARALAKDLVP